MKPKKKKIRDLRSSSSTLEPIFAIPEDESLEFDKILRETEVKMPTIKPTFATEINPKRTSCSTNSTISKLSSNSRKIKTKLFKQVTGIEYVSSASSNSLDSVISKKKKKLDVIKPS